MSNHFETFGRKLAQDILRRTGELLIEVGNEQVPILKPALEELQNGTRRYPKSKTSHRVKSYT
ncbi:hypothetical protein [Hydrocoleum sp. CS-953]|uniref:hypothetical protein n=1 Tax=Microcoleaceae TaxID=1892252 RepID=UPI000B9A5621|nr:hypothetical protein [Hydrocoleum sp. CS-953]OZH54311.1 hypothetical protein AFK68_11755 [Hydrocoleum sp. CS-953]